MSVHRLLVLVLTCLALVHPLAIRAQETPTELPAPLLEIADIRGGAGGKATFDVVVKNLPADATRAELTLDLRIRDLGDASVAVGPALPMGGVVVVDGAAAPVYTLNVTAPEGGTLSNGTVAKVTVALPKRIVGRRVVEASGAIITADGAPATPFDIATNTIAVSLVYTPVTLFALLAGVVAGIFALARLRALEGFFKYFPPLIWMYFVPMMLTTLGITPDQSALYSPFMSRIILPAVLVLLLIPSDVRSIAQLGPRALIIMLIATAGIVIGAIFSTWLFYTMFPDSLPEGTWKGIAALSGSWIGGSPNMFAVMETVKTPPNIIGPLVVVDTVLAYSWLGILIALSSYQKAIDKKHKADASIIDAISTKLEAEQEQNSTRPKTADIAFMIGVAFVVSQLCLVLAKPLYDLLDRVGVFHEYLSPVINAYGWGILLITAAGLLLSTTKVRRLDYSGASSLGYTGLYILLTCYGAQANFQAVLEVPVFFGIGAVWLLIHIVILYIGVRVTRSPIFLGATSSMANIGGTASAPVVAASYNSSMAPVGLLMAILGGVLGTPLALFVIATACKAIAGE